MLKILWLLLGFSALLTALYLAAEEADWRRQQLVRRFSAYLQEAGGTRYPIVSEETVVGRSRRMADLVPSIPGARTRAQRQALDKLSGCHLEIFHRENAFFLQNLQRDRPLAVLRDESCVMQPLAPREELRLRHGDEICLTRSLSLWFYEGEVL